MLGFTRCEALSSRPVKWQPSGLILSLARHSEDVLEADRGGGALLDDEFEIEGGENVSQRFQLGAAFTLFQLRDCRLPQAGLLTKLGLCQAFQFALRKRCDRPTDMMGFPAALFRRALRFGLEQSVGTNSATFVGFRWEQHKPA